MSDVILIVDDEPAIRQMLGFALSQAGYRFVEAGNAVEAQAVIASAPPDLILLDWMLPGISGIDLARRLRANAKTRDLPIIMLTAKAEEEEKVKGLDRGADDYVTKPFSTRELLARIKAVLRRTVVPDAQGKIDVAGLCVDTTTHRVTAQGTPLKLSATEFKLLQFFMTHAERVYTRGQLLDQVWGDNVYIEERTVDVHIRRLRRLLAPYGYDRFVQTVRSVGYRFSTQ